MSLPHDVDNGVLVEARSQILSSAVCYISMVDLVGQSGLCMSELIHHRCCLPHTLFSALPPYTNTLVGVVKLDVPFLLTTAMETFTF